MATSGFLSTTYTKTLKDTYSGHYQQGKLTVTVSAAGKVDWTITMTNDGGSTQGRAVTLFLKIYDKLIYDSYTTYSSSSTSSWLTFPTGHNTSKSGSFTLSKTSATELRIRFGICCMQSVTGKEDNTSAWSIGKWSSEVMTRKIWTLGDPPTVAITDNGNNTFTISGNVATNGTNTYEGSTAVFYTTNGNTPSTGDDSGNGYETNGTVKVQFLGMSTGTPYTTGAIGISATRTVKALTKSAFTLRADTSVWVGSKQTSVISKSITFYAPTNPGTPTLDSSSLKNNKLTIKKNWKYTWTAATVGGGKMSIKGYRIRIYKNGSLVKGITRTSADSAKYDITLGRNDKGTNEYLDISFGTARSITFNPVTLGFAPNNTVQVGIFAWIVDGRGSTVWSGNGNSQVWSATSKVVRDGIVHIHNGSSWTEGQVYVHNGTTWVEADVVKVHDGSSWKESS